jgi:hypothetical protein
MHPEPARLAASPADYERFKLEKHHIQQWEDGQRVDTAAPNIEWWYFDTDLDDGAKLAVIFCTKDASRPNQPLEPLIEIDLDLPDGRRLMKYGYYKAEEFSASKDGCDVRIGPYRFSGNLHEYTITAAAEDLWAEVKLEGMTEPWRPETGHLFFGPKDEQFFAWSPFVPFGKVTATYKIGSEVHEATGTGYHDHNWMNTEMGHLLDHWWWTRGDVGSYTFIMAHLVAAKKYGLAPFEFYMLARDGEVIADDGARVTFTTSGSEVDQHTGKPFPEAICFDYRDGDTRYEVTITRQKTLVTQRFLDFTKGWQKVVGELIRYPGGYLRFSALVSMNCYQGDQRIEHYEKTGVFEQMYFARKIPELA